MHGATIKIINAVKDVYQRGQADPDNQRPD
jgi:hypothetical protein